jgi:MscS family membrane protein
MQIWLERSSRVIVWIIGIAIILELFGIQIGPLVAGLGLFSVAVALGAQDFFKNLISGILIIGENRFQPGDRIEVPGQLHGVVDTIGFRSTIIKTFDTSPMIIPNKDLSDMRLINHGNMEYRRINWVINLIYSTSLEDLEKICDQISNHIKESDDFVDNPNQEHLVTINELGASSIDVGILCYSDVCGFSEFKKIKHRLIKNIIQIVESNNSEFAYPSSSIFVESLPKNSE